VFPHLIEAVASILVKANGCFEWQRLPQEAAMLPQVERQRVPVRDLSPLRCSGPATLSLNLI
jgi:hypothetical protein